MNTIVERKIGVTWAYRRYWNLRNWVGSCIYKEAWTEGLKNQCCSIPSQLLAAASWLNLWHLLWAFWLEQHKSKGNKLCWQETWEGKILSLKRMLSTFSRYSVFLPATTSNPLLMPTTTKSSIAKGEIREKIWSLTEGDFSELLYHFSYKCLVWWLYMSASLLCYIGGILTIKS